MILMMWAHPLRVCGVYRLPPVLKMSTREQIRTLREEQSPAFTLRCMMKSFSRVVVSISGLLGFSTAIVTP